MPDDRIRISALPAATTPSDADVLAGVQSGTTKKFSLATIKSWLQAVFVPLSRTVNNKALSSDITLDASDIGAQEKILVSGILKGDGAGGVSAAVAGTDYATPDQLDDKADQSELATVESGTTASRAYAVGEYFCWHGLLYRVTSAISSGGTFTPGTNCVETTVTKMLTLRSGTFTTNANGRVSSGLYWTQGYIVQAWAQSREVRVYSNSSNAQGFLVLDTSGNPVASTSVPITYLVYNYNL